MNTIDAWLACDDDGTQTIFLFEPRIVGIWISCEHGYRLCKTSDHAINPGECRPVKLRVAIAGSEADDPGHWQAAAEVEAACHDEARIERAAAFAAIREIVELFRFDSSTRTLEISAILKRHGIEVAE